MNRGGMSEPRVHQSGMLSKIEQKLREMRSMLSMCSFARTSKAQASMIIRVNVAKRPKRRASAAIDV